MKAILRPLLFFIGILITFNLQAQSKTVYYFISDAFPDRDSVCGVTLREIKTYENLYIWSKYPKPIEALSPGEFFDEFLLKNGYVAVATEKNPKDYQRYVDAQRPAKDSSRGAWLSSNPYIKIADKPSTIAFYCQVIKQDSPSQRIWAAIYKPFKSKFPIENIRIWSGYNNVPKPIDINKTTFKRFLLENGNAEIINLNIAWSKDKEAQQHAVDSHLGKWESVRKPNDPLTTSNNLADTGYLKNSIKSSHHEDKRDSQNTPHLQSDKSALNELRDEFKKHPTTYSVILIVVGAFITCWVTRLDKIIVDFFRIKKRNILIIGLANSDKRSLWLHLKSEDSFLPDSDDNYFIPHVEKLRIKKHGKRDLSPTICETPASNKRVMIDGLKRYSHDVLVFVIALKDDSSPCTDEEDMIAEVSNAIYLGKIKPKSFAVFVNVCPLKDDNTLDMKEVKKISDNYMKQLAKHFKLLSELSGKINVQQRQPFCGNAKSPKDAEKFFSGVLI